ncbi:MAG TPA: hypothetical protein VM450_16005 [Thermomicrobiales bacterium]|nr:hypothetical protein [Thermomicrobiales bacterium]
MVPGETTPALELGTPEIQSSIAGQRLIVPIRNTGNVLLKPAGELTLTDASGNEALRQQLAMGSVYAGMETTLEVPLPPALPEGDYEVALDLKDAETAVTASVVPAPVTLSREVEKEDPLAITTATVTPMPAADDVQFAVVSLTVENREMPVNGAQVLLTVTHDGEPVEDFMLANAVTLQQGETSVEQRYIPLTGWAPGEWTFAITLQSVDPQTGATATLLTADIDQTIVIGE